MEFFNEFRLSNFFNNPVRPNEQKTGDMPVLRFLNKNNFLI